MPVTPAAGPLPDASAPARTPDTWTGARLGLLIVVLAMLSMLGPFSIDTPMPAFTQMGEAFDVSTAQMQIVVSAYLLAFAVMSPFHGPLSDAVGRRPVMLAGLGIYVIASLGAALAPTFEALVGFRVLQGLSAGGGVIVGRTIIRDLFDGVRAQQLMSQVMMIFSLAPAIAPLVGGGLLQIASWPIVFAFMVVMGALMFVAVWRLLPETHPVDRRTRFNATTLLRSLGEVSRSWRFHRVAWSAALTFGGQFLYVGASAIIVVDLLGKGETDFWMLFGPLIVGILIGSTLSSRLAGVITRRQLISYSMLGSLVAAGINIALAGLPATDHLPWVVWGPMFIALASSAAYPTQQLVLLDMFPGHRGAAVSMFTFFTLVLNGLTAALVVPHMTGSMLQLALCAGAMIVLGCLLWAVHVRITPPPPDPAVVLLVEPVPEPDAGPALER